MKTQFKSLSRLQLLGLATWFKTMFPSKKQYRYELLNASSVLISDNDVVDDVYNTGGIKLVYRVYTEIPRFLYLCGSKINLRPIVTNTETAVYFKPLKKYWPKAYTLPYELKGKESSPFLNCWWRIKRDFSDINKEVGSIRIRDIVYHSDKSLSHNLNLQSNKFVVLTK